ncbi:MAG: hypothetical protein O3B90_00790 [Actinomycetota bacterium]|jgi:hypothetical protein|uniref:sunset domain-containing protein n=1 Tax=uncultured Ilumatobacter sp. TaxID=879968 RepID=UPI00374F0BB6|nr:hypothetical protein [Actinomycetota bacterium]
MTWMVTVVRRSLWLVLIGGIGGATWSWWRDRTAPPASPAPPEWPPLDPARATTSESSTTAHTSTGTLQRSAPAVASVVNVLADSPDPRSNAVTGSWLPPTAGGSCPASHLIKANDKSGIFHVPGGRFYDRTKAARCYATAAEAVADGYRSAQA